MTKPGSSENDGSQADAESVEVVDSSSVSEGPRKSRRGAGTVLHPVSGLVVIGLDNALFGANALTLGWATPVVCLVAFLLASTGVFLVQKIQARDGFLKSAAKAVFCGVFAGLPTSLMGTALGAVILLLSGLSRFSRGRPLPK